MILKDIVGPTVFTPEEYRDCFNIISKNETGKISMQEVTESLLECDEQPAEDEVMEVII